MRKAKQLPKTVLIIGPTSPPSNGMSEATEYLMGSSLLGNRFRLIHLDTADHRPIANVGKFDLINILLALKNGFQFLWALITTRPAIVYMPIAQNRLGFLRDILFLLPARAFGKKVIVHLHGSHFNVFYQSASPLMRWIIRQSLSRVRCAIVLGEGMTNIFEGIIPKTKIRVIPNGINDFGDTDVRRLPTSPRHQVLFLSTLKNEKGCLDIIRAVPTVCKKIKSVKFFFAGGWANEVDKKKAQDLISKLGIDKYVEFTGPVRPPFKYQLFHEADLFVFPPFQDEGQPYVILEAMCAGLPIITTRVGALGETLTEGKNALFIAKRDTEQMAEKIVALLSDDKLSAQLGRANRERFLKHYTLDRWVDNMFNVLTEVMQMDDN